VQSLGLVKPQQSLHQRPIVDACTLPDLAVVLV
jgi:hypothetical protein